jgi:hypothetical protein
VQLAQDSLHPAISANGNRIAFESSDFVVGISLVYVRDVSMATLDLCADSIGPYGLTFNASISGDGTTVVLESRETTGIGNHIWGYSTRIQSSNKIALICASGSPSRNSVSYDGSRIAYVESLSSGKNPIRVASIDWSNGGAISGVSDPLYPPPNEEFGRPTLSQDGNVITVSSPDSLIPGDTNGAWDLYLSTLENDIHGNPGTFTEPVLVDVSVAGSWPTGSSDFPSMSADAYSIAFASDAADLVNNDTNGTRDVFLSDMSGVASTRFYGRGYPNSGGIIPRLSVSPAPVLGASITLSLDNSSGIDATALLIVSAQRADVSLNFGATILVDLSVSTMLMLSVPAAGLSLPSTIPNDPSLNGISVYLQAIELDSTAPHHLTFTNGLDTHFGR